MSSRETNSEAVSAAGEEAGDWLAGCELEADLRVKYDVDKITSKRTKRPAARARMRILVLEDIRKFSTGGRDQAI